jgi:hypothetical protein
MKKQRKQKSQKKIIAGVIFAIIISFAGYSYAIASTTLSASDMKTKNNKIARIRTNIAELELEYLSLLDGVSLYDANNLNLQETKNTGYISLKKDTHVAYLY